MVALARHVGATAADADVPLMEAGLDSLGAVELRNRLQGMVAEGVRLPTTIVFDHPTARQLTSVLDSDRSVSSHSAAPATRSSDESVSVALSAACSVLASGVRSCSVWITVGVGQDLITKVPPSRWDLALQPVVGEPVASRVRHGGFVRGAELFDHGFFGVSLAEAGSMDPQQRLLLELGYEALHGAAFDRAALLGSGTAVCVGICNNDFADVLKASAAASSVYAGSGASFSIASGRLSYVLGLHGTCLSVDTACSSALVAGHSAVRAIQLVECGQALAAAVCLTLLPTMGYIFAIAGMTSATGRCHTFDSRANGYVRSEACVAMALRPREQGAAGPRLRGSAVRQDGRSASLTAPNGQAQQMLLRSALADAAASLLQVCCVEAHGTGTRLGDPIEASALSSVLLAERSASKALMIVSAKANAGHCEPAAGGVGLVKLVESICRLKAAPNAQLRTINESVRAGVQDGTGACILPTQAASVTAILPETLSGVSSFGASGTIVHMVLHTVGGGCSVGASLRFRRCCFVWALPSGQHACEPSLDSILGLYSTRWATVTMATPHAMQAWLLLSLRAGGKAAMLTSTLAEGGIDAYSRQRWCGTVLCLTDAPSCAVVESGVSAAVHAASQAICLGASSLLLLTSGAQCPLPAAAPSPLSGASHGWVWGLSRVLRLEHSAIAIRTLDISSEADTRVAASRFGSAVNDESAAAVETELASRWGRVYAARLQRQEPVHCA